MGKILLVETNYFGYQDKIRESFERKGFQVDWMDDRPSNSMISKGLIRINPALQKRKINDYFYKTIAPKAIKEQYDFVIVVLGQSFSSKMFTDLKKDMKHSKFILYLWDSVKNFPQFAELSKGFDVTFSFDKDDCSKYGFTFMPLFYSNEVAEITRNPSTFKTKYDVSFVGTVKKGKLPFLEQLKKELSERYKNIHFYYYLQSKLVYWFNKLTNREFKGKRSKDFVYQKMSYEDTIRLSEESEIVLDVPMANQKGLSMRTFETLAMGKKLITTNETIADYEFYNPKNIYIFKGKIDFSNEFFNSSFDVTKQSEFDYYKIDNWTERLIK